VSQTSKANSYLAVSSWWYSRNIGLISLIAIQVSYYPILVSIVHSPAGNIVEIISTVAKIMPLISLFQIFHGISAVTGAIARARGKQVRWKYCPPNVLLFMRGFFKITGALVNLGAYYIMGQRVIILNQ
jgi:hypothetical protein